MSTTAQQPDNREETETVEAEAETIEHEKKLFQRRIARRQRTLFAIDVLVVAATAVTVIATVLALIPFFVQWTFNYEYDEVTSGSMSGTFETGEIVITAPYVGEKLEVAQIVKVQGEGTRYVHRIVVVNEDGTFITKGDANDSTDLVQPTKSDVKGTYVSYLEGPEAWFVTVFSPDKVWADEVVVAAQTGQWDVVIDHVPSAPWGFLALLVAVMVFFWFVPDFRQYLQNKAKAKQAVEYELLKRSVAVAQKSIIEQQAAITDHDESINEVVPIVEEIVQERETAKAEREAADADLEKAFSEWNPNDPVYDEFEAPEEEMISEQSFETALPPVDDDDNSAPFPTIGPKTFSSSLAPVVDWTPRFRVTQEEVALPALLEVEAQVIVEESVEAPAQVFTAPVATPGNGLRAEQALMASLHAIRTDKTRSTLSASN